MPLHCELLSRELGLPQFKVAATATLLDEGCTVPFIARYRKEVTGSLDEVAIVAIRDGLEQLAETDKRREAILISLKERELLTDELAAALQKARSMTALEDIYLPYRPKRRTKATVAREKGLEPLARTLMAQEGVNPDEAARQFICSKKGVETTDAALEGAQHILAEEVSESPRARATMRALFVRYGRLKSKARSGAKKDDPRFTDWLDWDEPMSRAPSHRILALFRGEAEGALSVSIRPPQELVLSELMPLFVTGSGRDSELVREAVEDGYRRLLEPAMETEARNALKLKADRDAIGVFVKNVREVLMASPLGQKRVMALDPGLRTGCKLVCLDETGELLHHETIFPHTSQAQRDEAARRTGELFQQYKIETVAVGNGTAGRETEAFLRDCLPSETHIYAVNESGASIYSASPLAREEFPKLDVSYRGAVSIGRRLMDPLAELVKIDPKSIGVGQYQHDVDQKELKKALNDVVSSCVNAVGVEVNTASPQLLSFVSGLSIKLAKSVVSRRRTDGPFRTRKDLLSVPGLGPKTFQQAAGFLRIQGGENPLDTSAVHPELYDLVQTMATDLGCSVRDLLDDENKRKAINPKQYVNDQVGLPTVTDILSELAKPGRDPRGPLKAFSFDPTVNQLSDLEPGMTLPGLVTNVTDFGAFVDVGVHQDGLVHISQLADRFVKDPHGIVSPGQAVTVTVLSVDLKRKRLSLSMKKNPTHPC
ncbi:MAG: RNA-binding transcriptional accessory protein [Dethiosulfovibrio peptidovorans]|nr:MAG: RNA-binding transcriptional accessory protein [Dethiosulfovibrio peptidovorans]